MSETEKQPNDELSVETLKQNAVEADRAWRYGKLLEKQQREYRPQLLRAQEAVESKLTPLLRRETEIANAILEIDRGHITDFQLRKPRAKKQQAAPVAEGEE